MLTYEYIWFGKSILHIATKIEVNQSCINMLNFVIVKPARNFSSIALEQKKDAMTAEYNLINFMLDKANIHVRDQKYIVQRDKTNLKQN